MEQKVKKTKSELAQENIALQDKIAELEAKAQLAQAQATAGMDPSLDKYMNELQTIKRVGRVDSDKIIVQEITDHKNISLWTKDGKRIGPMHPHNAEKAFKSFWALGEQLSAQQPTPEQIAAYKQTPEYKKKLAAHLAKRAEKEKSRGSGTMEKYAKVIAQQTGIAIEKLTDVLSAKDIKPATEGHKAQ